MKAGKVGVNCLLDKTSRTMRYSIELKMSIVTMYEISRGSQQVWWRIPPAVARPLWMDFIVQDIARGRGFGLIRTLCSSRI